MSEIRVAGKHVGMPCDQWCRILAEKEDGRLVCESLGDREVIWLIDPMQITGVRLTETLTLDVSRIGVSGGRRN